MSLEAARLAFLTGKTTTISPKEDGVKGEQIVQVGEDTHASVADALASVPARPAPALNAARLAFQTGKIVNVSQLEPENEEKK